LKTRIPKSYHFFVPDEGTDGGDLGIRRVSSLNLAEHSQKLVKASDSIHVNIITQKTAIVKDSNPCTIQERGKLSSLSLFEERTVPTELSCFKASK
jgi:hypothetical protein